MKLSIVVPIYRVEKYIRECVESIINQEDNLFSQVELILVNDGTPDKSIEVIQDLIDEYSNIRLINQHNQGLSMARNNGLAVAEGDYVWFVDSDDWLAEGALNDLFHYLDGKSDTVVIGSVEVWDDKNNDFHIYFPSVETMSGKEAFRRDCAQYYTSVLTIYRTEFLKQNHLSFLPGVLHEDNEFCPIVSYLSQCTTYIPNKLYYIRRAINDGRKSITTTVNPKRAYDGLIVCDSLLRFSENRVIEEDIKLKFYHLISLCLNNNVFPIILHCGKDEENRFNELYYNSYRYFSRCLSRGNLKTKLEAILFTLFPRKILTVFKIMHKINSRIVRSEQYK